MIAVDWGTTSFRAYRLDAAGVVLEQRSAAAGLLACQGAFEAVLVQQLKGWDDDTVLMAGMIGSRSGWHEVPYVDCPAGLDEVAAGMLQIDVPALPGRRVFIAPGVAQHGGDRPPEVMRGEEVQILGLADRLSGRGTHTLCLPGTHSKWVRLRAGRIESLRTAMTGELYALLRRHSLLAALMPGVADDGDDADAFNRGLAESARDGGLGHQLFGVRTLGLFGALSPAQAPSYLSGLLIGHELRGLLPRRRTTVHLVGESALLQRYQRALATLAVDAQVHGDASSARGLFRLAGARAGLR